MSDSILFQSAQIGSLKVPNRFIRSATWEGLAAPDGGCTDELVRLMGELAEGGVGLIISSHAFVRPEGYAVRGQLGIRSRRLHPRACPDDGSRPPQGREDHSAACPRRPSGRHAAHGAAGPGPVACRRPRENEASRDDGGGHRRHDQGLRRGGPSGKEGRLRRGPDPCRPRLSSQPVPLALV